MNDKEKQALIRAALSNGAGRKTLLGNPFAGLLPSKPNTLEIARKMFPIQQIPPGAIPFDELLRKCEECERVGGHEPGCRLGLLEDVHES